MNDKVPDILDLEEENKKLRELLAMAYCPLPMMYTDDGEMQDNTCHPCIDFRRDSVPDMARKMCERTQMLFTLAGNDLTRVPVTDFHKERAAEMFGVPYDQVTDAQRNTAKGAYFFYDYFTGPAKSK